MTAMRVIHTGPDHRPQVEPVFVDEVEVIIRYGGIESTPESRGASAMNGVGARAGCGR
jgi:hypothetical protein